MSNDETKENQIGSFWFEQDASSCHLQVQLHWHDDAPAARIVAPSDVIERYADTLGIRANDDIIRLEVALGYGVIIAAFADMALTITGDRSAWPNKYGELRSRRKKEDQLH